MMSSFSKDSLDIALNSLLYPKKCSDNLVEFDRSMKVKVYPEKDYGLDKVNQNKGYEAFVTKMKEVMGGEVPHPVIMGFCALDKPTKACQDGQHAVVLAGYREYCDDGKPKKCKYEVKAGNSWGESWQKGHNDGWIDAKTLFDRTFYGEASMLWLED
jgi:C1A family cysteine protease